MYINFKSKYKKFFWLLLGFIISCVFISNVKAITSHSVISNNNYNIDNLNFTYNGYTYNKTNIYNKISSYLTNNTNYTLNDFKYIFIGIPSNKNTDANSTLHNIYIDMFGSDFNPISFDSSGVAFSYWNSNTGSNLAYHFEISFINNNITFKDNSNKRLYSMFSGNSSSYINTYTNFPIELSMINNTSSYSDYIHFYIGNMGYNFNVPLNNDYTVNFHLNGGTVWDSSDLLNMHLIEEDYSINTTSNELAEYLTHITPLKNYSIFDGWYFDSEFTEPYSSSADLSEYVSQSSNIVEINNLLDTSQGYQLGYISSSNVFTSHNQTALFNQKIYLEPGTTYTFSTKNNVDNMVISLYDSNNNFLGRVKEENTNKIVYTAGNNVSYVKFAVNIDNNTITEQKINNAEIIVEEGNTRTETSNVISNDINLYAKFDLYDYLQGYKKIDLTTNDKYLMISDVTSGSVFIPTQDFEQYGGRLSYYDNDLDIQPYTSYIQDYNKMPDGEFIKQDFDLSQFYGADWVMFSKYIYLEGEDNISYSIWVPDTSYNSQVTITPNSSGGNTYDFEYKDTNGDIQDGQVNSVDLSQDNPLLGNIFSDFSSNTFGLTSIITAPLSLIRSLSSTSCTPLNLPLPFVGGTLTLPCMYDFYSNTFGVLFTLYQTITFGVVAYWVLVRIFNMVKDFKNPDHDEIEVIDL